jgi:hypothetical protein
MRIRRTKPNVRTRPMAPVPLPLAPSHFGEAPVTPAFPLHRDFCRCPECS